MRLQRGRVGQPDEIEGRGLLEIELAAAGKQALSRGHEDEPVLAEREALDIVGQRMFGGKAEIGRTSRNGSRDVRALALLDVDIDIGLIAQERRKRSRQMF